MDNEQNLRAAVSAFMAMLYERTAEAHDMIRTMSADQRRAYYQKIFTYVASRSAQAARAAQHVYAGELDQLIDQHTIAKLTMEKQMVVDSLDDVIKALEQACLSGAKMLTAGYRAGKHLLPPTWPLPGSVDSLEVVIAALLPLLAFVGIRYMPRTMWLGIVYGYGILVVLSVSMQLIR